MTAPVQPSPAPSPPDSAATRIAATAESWRRKLLDLTKRNRALAFRPNKVSTVTIVDEQPAEVFRTLYIRERAMKFKAAEEMPAPGARPSALGQGGTTT